MKHGRGRVRALCTAWSLRVLWCGGPSGLCGTCIRVWDSLAWRIGLHRMAVLGGTEDRLAYFVVAGLPRRHQKSGYDGDFEHHKRGRQKAETTADPEQCRQQLPIRWRHHPRHDAEHHRETNDHRQVPEHAPHDATLARIEVLLQQGGSRSSALQHGTCTVGDSASWPCRGLGRPGGTISRRLLWNTHRLAFVFVRGVLRNWEPQRVRRTSWPSAPPGVRQHPKRGPHKQNLEQEEGGV